MTTVFFNEIHYENVGTDVNEGVEVAGPAGTNLDGWKIVLYDGSGSESGEATIKGLLSNQQNGFGTIYYRIALPNQKGGHGLALVDGLGKLRHFISYGVSTSVTATNGPALGRTSEVVTAIETTRTAVGSSVQLIGKGSTYEDFKWALLKSNSFGSVNAGQEFVALPREPTMGIFTEPAEVPPVTTTPATPKPQVVQSLDLYVDKNRTAHHTDKLHAKEFFAVRRGQAFEIGLVATAEVTQAIVKFAAYPETKQVYTVNVTRSTDGNPETEWVGYFSGLSGGKTNVTIAIPGRATVGQYTVSASGNGGKTWTAGDVVYILFNAWSKHDDVFLDGEAERNEYVLGEDGFIWVGSYFNFSPRGWSFAQFNTKSFQASLQLLQRMKFADRSDAVLVSRNYSALVNSNDDQGVLVGRWSGDYTGGTSPTAWTGSADILKEYHTAYLLKNAPVKFGQCWVYSGLLTTVLRAVGIPARSVTNFASAHDYPIPTYNRAVDKYFLADGVTEDSDKTVDSVWNFHVWNDAWMARRDLGSSRYTGWQAVDATPQEVSGGKYQMGPVPIVAVKNGEKNLNYDLEFVYSEVNADEKYYVADGRGGYKLVRTITDSIGQYISTKAVGSNARQDITLDYKYKEGSPEERASHGADKTGGDATFKLNVDQTAKLGQPVNAQLVINAKSKTSTVKVEFAAHIVSYTGKPVALIAQTSNTVKVSPGTATSVNFGINAAQYVPKLKGTFGIVFRAYAWVQETEQATIVQQEFDFVADDLAVTITPANPKKNTDGKATVVFKNPLNITLTNLELAVEGTDLTKVQRFKYAYPYSFASLYLFFDCGTSLKPGETITQDIALRFWAAGKKVLIALLDSAEINDLRGLLEVNVA